MTILIRNARNDELPTIVAIDDDASRMFAHAGMVFDLPSDHPYVLAERQCWAEALRARSVFIADDGSEAVGIAVLKMCDGQPYLEQLSVRMSHMRQGIGTALLTRAMEWAGDRSLWLTTYEHLRWNAPFYRRFGFSAVPEDEHGPEIQATISSERAALPLPENRVVMRRRGSE